jgi:hypothetical protein
MQPYDTALYAHHALNPLPTKGTLDVLAYHNIVIDSSHRDVSRYPDVNSFEVELIEDLDDVTNVELLHSVVPFSSPLIVSHSSTFVFSTAVGRNTVNIPLGNYTVTTMADALVKAMRAFDPMMDVVYDEILDGFTFLSLGNVFRLIFEGPSNYLATILGFKRQCAYACDGILFTVHSEFRKNFLPNDCIVMYITQLDMWKSTGSKLHGAFAIFNAKGVRTPLRLSQKPLSPPLKRLTKFTIRCFDKFGNPYDFQNQDVRLELGVSTLKHRGYTL